MIQSLGTCVREYKKPASLTPIFVSLEVIMEVIIPLLMVELIDKGIEAGNMNEIVKIGMALVVIAILSLIFGVLAGMFAAKASTGFACNLRHDMYYNVQNFSFKNIDKFSTSSIITRLTTDVTNVQNAFQMITRISVRCPLMLIFSLAMAFSINKQVSLVFLCAVPVLALGLFFIMTNAHPIFERVFKTYDKLNNVVEENLRGSRVVKSYVREDFEIAKFNDVSGNIYKDFVKAEKLIALNSPLMQFVMYSSMLLISWVGAKLIVTSTMTTGDLMGLITYAMQILISLMMLSMVLVMLVISKASAERIVEILEEKSDIYSPENGVTEVNDGSVIFKNVSFSNSDTKKKLGLSNSD